MKLKFSRSWNSSTQPRKQRKYAYNAPLHIKRNFLSSHLSKELRQKHGIRSIIIRKDDKVKVMRGQHKNKVGKIERVNTKFCKVYITGIDLTKKEGTKVLVPFHPSNLLITELNLNDKTRKLKQKVDEKKQQPTPDKNISQSYKKTKKIADKKAKQEGKKND